MRSSGGSEEHAAPRPGERTDDRGWTRAELLRRAAGGGAGLAVLGGFPGLGRLVETAPALAGPAATGDVRRFVSRPDLKPPRITIVRPARSTADGQLFLAPSSGPGQRGAMIVDDDGELVWFHGTFPKTAMDFRTQVYKGKHVLTWWEGQYVKGIGQIGDYVVVDGSYREIARFRPSNGLRPDFHEYLLTPEGTALVTSHDTKSANLSSVGGSAGGRVLGGVVQELEIPGGRVLWEWRSLDHVGIEETYQTEVGDPFDYFHVNSIGFDYDGNLIVSARNTWTVYKVDRRSGQVIWRLGGRKSDFAMGRGTLFAFQHDARTHDHGRLLSVFDNGPHPKTKPQSRGLVLAVDTARMRVSLARELMHSPPLFARVTGNTQLLPDGGVLVCYGSTGYFTEFDAHGNVRFDARLPEGGQNYRVKRFQWAGQPSKPPELVARRTSSGETLFVSWNGATGVASWQVRTGATSSRLGDAGTMPRQGFETVFPAPPGARYVGVVALDGRGSALGRSNVVKI